jgi:hypothetical protein
MKQNYEKPVETADDVLQRNQTVYINALYYAVFLK